MRDSDINNPLYPKLVQDIRFSDTAPAQADWTSEAGTAGNTRRGGLLHCSVGDGDAIDAVKFDASVVDANGLLHGLLEGMRFD